VEGEDVYKQLLLNDIHNAADKEKQVLKVAAELLDVSHIGPAVAKACSMYSGMQFADKFLVADTVPTAYHEMVSSGCVF